MNDPPRAGDGQSVDAGGELVPERDLLVSVLDNLPESIYVKDSAGRYLASNKQHRELLGECSPDQVLGRTIHDFLPEQTALALSELDRRVIDDGAEIIEREELVDTPDGGRRWKSITKVPLVMPDGAVRGVVGITRDTTARRMAEERLKTANRELEESRERLVQALADLRRSHDSLQQMQDQLIETEKYQSVGRLAAGVAHEVKNPLAILKMGTEFLARECGGERAELQSAIREMNEAIERAENIVRELLDFASNRDLNLEQVDINELVDKSLSLMGHTLSHSGVEVRREFAAGLPRLRVDAAKIEQVFVNILLNAVQALGRNGGELTVRTLVRPSTEVLTHGGGRSRSILRHSGRDVVVEIRDSGPGIARDKLGKVFDPFYTTKPTGEGTGLGLSVSRRIMQRHRGSLDLMNHPDGGAVAVISLPEH